MDPDNIDQQLMLAKREVVVDAATNPTLRITKANQVYHVKGTGTVTVAAPDVAGVQATFVAAHSSVNAAIVFPAAIENVGPYTTVTMGTQLDTFDVVSYHALATNTLRWVLKSQYNCALS